MNPIEYAGRTMAFCFTAPTRIRQSLDIEKLRNPIMQGLAFGLFNSGAYALLSKYVIFKEEGLTKPSYYMSAAILLSNISSGIYELIRIRRNDRIIQGSLEDVGGEKQCPH